jgi:putative tryptophan/tyrosine transport system substrate-binding protein
MNRRTFIGSLGASVLAASLAASAQPAGKVYRIGYVNLRAGPAAVDEAFVQGLRDLGYVVGRNLDIEYRWADNDTARFEAQVDELVRLNVDVIVTSATPAIRVAMRATRTIPIVIAAAADPVGTGLVSNLAHPGGNVTGLSLLSNDLARKRLQLLHQLLPSAARVALLAWQVPEAAALPAGRNSTERMIAETRAAGLQSGVEVSAQVVTAPTELPRAFARMKRDRVQAVIIQNSSFMYEKRAEVFGTLSRERLPAMYEARNYVEEGGLVSYGPDVQDIYRRAAGYVDRILKGARPGDLAIEQPNRFELVINLKTATALGLTIPQSVLVRADDVIH